MAMIFNFQEFLESGICKLFQKGTFAYWSWFDGMVPRNLHMCGYLRQSDAKEFVVIFLFQEGRSMNVAVSSVLTTAE
jgi:phage terminase large subunit-like protein